MMVVKTTHRIFRDQKKHQNDREYLSEKLHPLIASIMLQQSRNATIDIKFSMKYYNETSP
jgi:hypothetical protein